MSRRAIHFLTITLVTLCLSSVSMFASSKGEATLEGWNILSARPGIAERALAEAQAYGINHLQLSHHLMMNLFEARDADKAARINELVEKAHDVGIEEVCIWDHALYSADYYPERFRTAPGGLIDLDNPEFWKWLQDDYREMLDLLPDIDGIILTFIETGTHVEDQYSTVMKTESEKLTALVNALSAVIIDERDLTLYVRTFVYTQSELDSMLACINSLENPKLRVMTKEVPHDFFLTHPLSKFVERIKFPTLIEFDAAHEYNGQTVVASAFPETQLKRWNYYKTLPNVIGYVARTDRYGETSVFGDMAEINLFALHQGTGNDSVDLPSLYEDFVASQYGPDEDGNLARALQLASEVVPSTIYTLGLCLSSHSRMDLANSMAYQRHVSGKWMQKPSISIGHGVDRTFHYWSDIVNTLAEPRFKKNDGKTVLSRESPWVFQHAWLDGEENMDETYLRYIITEKEYGVQKAQAALDLVEKACSKSESLSESLLDLKETLQRTLLTAKLYLGASKVYFGYRVFARGDSHQSDFVKRSLEEGLKQTRDIALTMIERDDDGPSGGQFSWKEDAYHALTYYNAVKFRTDDNFGPGFFANFSFRNLSDIEKNAILDRAL